VVKLHWRSSLLGIQLIAVAVFATACEHHIVDPALPSTAIAFVPPPVYAKWWATTESCSGVTGSLASVTWYVVPGVSEFQLKRETVSGYWTEASNTIVIADSSQFDGSVVRHEMLHALIRTSGHPRSAFLERCAGVVSCTSQCVADAGPAPKLSVTPPTVPADSLEIGLQLSPDPPSVGIDGGVFSLIVSVRNPTDHPVVASLTGSGGVVSAPFSYEIRAAFSPGVKIQGALNLSDPSITRFAAGETKRQYFDFVIGNVVKNRTVTNGVYRISGSYGGHSAFIAAVTIGPP